MSIAPSLIETMRREIKCAPHGLRTVYAQRWAKLLNRSVQNIYALVQDECGGRERKSAPFNPEYQEWTRIVFAVKKCPPNGAGEISTDQSVKLAVQWHLAPVQALDVPDSTYNAIARKMGLTKRERRVSRFQADRPNRLHHFDASSSKYFYIHRKASGGDYVLRLHRPGSGDYKNKPVPCDRLRPWYFGTVDDHSGRFSCIVVAAEGENVAHSLLALDHAWREMGTPDELLADQGMLKKGNVSRDLIERLDIKLPESMPYAKEAHGKIERPWRTLWQRWEKPFFAGDWQKVEILLSEFSQQFQNFLADDYNQMAHRWEKGVTKMQAWQRINLHGGIVQFPENAIATVARRKKRTINADGILQYEGKFYEVKHLHNAKVIVFEGVFVDRLVVQDLADGKKYEVRDFKPNNVGEYKAHKDTPHQTLVKESAQMLSGAAPQLYQAKKPAAEKIIPMPTRIKEEREIDNPMDVTRYSTMDDAWRNFMSILGAVRLTDEEREEARALIVESGLDKRTVQDTALTLREMMEAERQRAVAGM